MKNALCFLCCFGILGWAQPDGWQEGIAYYRSAVRAYPLVTLGEIHQLEAQFVFLRMPDQAHYILPPPETFADEILWQELNRRSRIRFGHDLDPATRETGRLRPLEN